MPPLQLPVRHLKTLALKLALLDAFPAELEPDSSAPYDQAQLEAIVEDVTGRLLGHPKLSVPGNRLDQTLQTVATETREEFDEHVRHLPVALGGPLSQFGQTIDALSCGDCAAQARLVPGATQADICAGQNDGHDALTVQHGGHCIRQIKRAYETAVDIGNRYYSQFTAKAPLCSVSLATEWLHDLDQIDNFPPDVHAWASAHLKDNESVVELKIKPRNFDRRTYESLPYIFLHECICHVHQGSVDAFGERGVVGNGDLFGEGWMDFVTHMIFTQVLQGNGPFGDAWGRELRDDGNYADRGHEIHLHRIDGRRAISRRLSQGVTAAKRLHRALKQVDVRPGATLIELSLGVNLLPLTGAQRELFVKSVHAIFRPGHEAHAEELLKDYLRTRELSRFVERCLGWFKEELHRAWL